MSFEDAWSSCRKSRLAAAHLRVTWPLGLAVHHANRSLTASGRVADPQRDVWRGRVRPTGTPTARDENASPSPTGQHVLPTPLEPETTKPKIGGRMENVSRSTIPVRLLDFRGHREVSRLMVGQGGQAALRRDFPRDPIALPEDRQAFASASRLDTFRCPAHQTRHSSATQHSSESQTAFLVRLLYEE